MVGHDHRPRRPGWSYGARQLRVQCFSLRNRDFLKAARVRGETQCLHHPRRDHADAHLAHRGDVPRLGRVCRPHCGRPPIRGARQPRCSELGHDALLGAEQRGARSGDAALGDHAGRLHRLARRSVRLLQLRFRRDLQPGVATGTPPGRLPSVRSAAYAARRRRRAQAHVRPELLLEVRHLWSPTPPMPARSLPSTTSTSTSPRGEFLAVVGESGCGKSTLLFAIAKLLNQPAVITGGSVVFRRPRDGGDERETASPRAMAGVLGRNAECDERAQPRDDTCGEQMSDACKAHSTMSDKEIDDRSAEVLRLVSIDPVHLDSYPHQLSGGMRQRSMIAMALLFTPSWSSWTSRRRPSMSSPSAR